MNTVTNPTKTPVKHSLNELLSTLQANAIKLWLEDEKLRVSAPQGVLTPALRDQLTEHKAALIALLQKHELEQIRPVTRTGQEPLSFAQQRLWFLQQLEENGAYNMPGLLRLIGTLDVGALQQAANAIVARHESLRTTFHERDGAVYQTIQPPTAVELPVVELTAMPAADQEAEALRLADHELRRTFDLATGPLLRLLLIRFTGRGAAIEHLLVVNMHHIISDGVSIALLVDELSALYAAALTGQAADLPALPVQYADYTVWQRKWLQGERLAEQNSYWQDKLGGALPLLELPTDRPRPAVQSFHGKTITFTIDAALTKKLLRFSQQHQATLFMTLLSAYSLLLHRYSQQTDILIGTPIAGRSHTEIERLIGLFVNTLVMRVQFDEQPTVAALLEQVRQTALDAYAHQDLPFERLIDLLDVERNLSYNPLFQVFFAMQTIDTTTITLPDLTMHAVEMETDLAKFDLSLMITETADGLDGALEYNTDLFDDSTAERLITHLQILLAAMVAQPQTKSAMLPMLTVAEHRQLIETWNDTAMPYPRTQCLHQLVEAQVARTPEKEAILDAGCRRKLTYSELNARANQVAHHLLALGVKPDDLVGICMERSEKLLIGLLGILKAGAGYVPIDPAFPKARIALMLADATPVVLVTESYFADEFAGETMPKLYLDSVGTDQGELADQPTHNPKTAVTADNLAYVIYTSGSTGKPKGVELCHRSVINFLWSMRARPGLTDTDHLLAVTTISFDIAVLELYLPLITGATILLADEEISADPAALMALLPQATVMQATPATWRMLLLAGWMGQSHLRIFVGGEALPIDLARQLLSRGCALWNLYGPTETTVWSSIQHVDLSTTPANGVATFDGEAATEHSVSIGRPIGNTQLYILDTHQQPVPIGVPGELYIGGDGLAHGYRHLPELTKEKFLPNPFHPGRFYRTGDLARYRTDGTIEYLGRIDNQVKIRGFRIELGEIESVLNDHAAIQQAVVVAQSDSSGGKRLVAFLIVPSTVSSTGPSSTQPSALAGDELRPFLRTRLPEYMVPSAFVVLDELPLTPNGKIDRRALIQMTTPEVDLSTHYVAPATELERTLVAIWAEVLQVDPAQVGTQHNFFDLGGHSLLAIQLLSRMRNTFQVELPIRELMDNPTIAGVAAAIAPMQQLAALFAGVPEGADGGRESIEI